MSDVKEAELVINGKSSIYEHNRKDEGKAISIELTQEDLRTVYNQAIPLYLLYIFSWTITAVAEGIYFCIVYKKTVRKM